MLSRGEAAIPLSRHNGEAWAEIMSFLSTPFTAFLSYYSCLVCLSRTDLYFTPFCFFCFLFNYFDTD